MLSVNYKKKLKLKQRDGDKCWRCGKTLDFSVTEDSNQHTIGLSFALIEVVDKTKPKTFDNLKLACRGCRMEEGNKNSGQGRAEFRNPKKIKQKLLTRDGNKCWKCGIEMNFKHTKQSDETMATIDHVVEKFCGGTNNIDNLKLACKRCNDTRSSKKANKILKKTKNK